MKLKVMCGNNLIGELTNTFDFQYDSAWINNSVGFDLSFCIPRAGLFSQEQTRTFFANLITEGDLRSTLAVGRHFDRNDIFAFLSEFGDDCAGALIITQDESRLKERPIRKITLDELDGKSDQKLPLQSMRYLF
jgi:HipA-like protein